MKLSRRNLQKLIHITLVFCVIYLGIMPAVPVQASGTTRYVATTGVDTGNCSSTSSPCRTIQYATNTSGSGDRILVAEGNYTYDAGVYSQCPSWATAIVCFMNKELTIVGGYSIYDWGTSSPATNLTVIDGQNAHRGVTIIGDNNIPTHLDMQGFTIRNGRGQSPNYLPNDPTGMGGGMWIIIASVHLKDVVFMNNQAIGANTNTGDGGGAFGGALRIESSPAGAISLLQRVDFDNNQSYGGTGPDRGGIAFGALFVYLSTVVVEDSTFTNNLAQGGNSSGSGISNTNGLHADALGGGISVENGDITLRRTTVTGNQVRGGNAGGNGGGSYGAGIFVEGVYQYTSSLVVEDSYVANNTATAGNAVTGGNSGGGGILATNSSVSIQQVEVLSNSSVGGSSTGAGKAGPGAGGGIYLFSIRSGVPRATIENVIVANNSVSQGSGVQSLGNGGGAGISVQGINVDITHATIAQNRLETGLILGQGLAILPWYLSSGYLPASVDLNYSIVADHTVGGNNATAVVSQVGSTLNFNHGLFSGNTKNTNVDGIPVPAGTINGLGTMKSAPSAGFISAGSPYYNYHIRYDSAARDQDLVCMLPEDIDRQNRPFNDGPDFGADEYRPFILGVAPGNGTLRLDWTAGAGTLDDSVHHYEVLVTCIDGGNPPNQGGCGQPINTGTATTLNLTGLSNYKNYYLTVYANGTSRSMIATSETVISFPTDLNLNLPLVIK